MLSTNSNGKETPKTKIGQKGRLKKMVAVGGQLPEVRGKLPEIR